MVILLPKKTAILIVLSALVLCACQQSPPAVGQAPRLSSGATLAPAEGKRGVAATSTDASADGETSAPASPRKLALYAVGDIMLDRAVGKRIKSAGCAAVIEKLAPELARADIVFGNLESPLSSVGAHDAPNCCFRADPAAAKVLTLGHFGMVSFANNHCLDPGREGYLRTLKRLEEIGVRYCGASAERSQASWLRIMEAQGLKVGFLAYTDLDFTHACYSKVPRDLALHRQAIGQAKNKCDLLIVSYHWGQEYAERPSERQKTVARAAVGGGADVVLGHHPHVLQGIGLEQGSPVLYSMGNFIFDQRPGVRMESALFKLFYEEGQGWLVKVVPVWLPPGRYGPEYPGPQKRDAILERMGKYSQALGTETRTESGVLLVNCPPPQGAGTD